MARLAAKIATMNDYSAPERDLKTAQQNLELLQAHVDGLGAENKAYRQRIEHLHRDREKLRTRVHSLEDRLTALGNTKTNRLRLFAGDLVRGRIATRDISKRLAQLRTAAEMPQPPASSVPAFSVREPEHSSLIPQVAFPEQIPHRSDLRVAAIMDDFSRAAFSYEFDYLSITPDDWRDELIEKPDLLMVESSFAGNGGAWTNEVAGFRPPRPPLAELTEWCRANGIPTVFWNKEDPSNFEWFIGAASAFDWVFTVDSESVMRYRAELGHDRVDVLPFAAQPVINYPPGSPEERTGSVAFAGSYYAKKHSDRRVQMEMILRPALEFDLDIFDRMGSSGDPRFAWPTEYQPHLRGSLSYAQTTEAYRRYQVFLNVNTVTSSPTMCARRVFELLSSGTAVVSGPARALAEMVPADALLISHSAEETREHLRTLLTSPEARASLGEAGRRWIAEGNTYTDRVEKILETLGLSR